MSPTVYNQRNIRLTINGITLLLASVLLMWIPYLQFAGYVMEVAALILLITGRTAFSPKHSRSVLISLWCFVMGMILSAVVIYSLYSQLYAIEVPAIRSSAMRSLVSSFFILLALDIVAGAVAGLTFVFSVQELMAENGRNLLWIAYGAWLLFGGYLAVFQAGQVFFGGLGGAVGVTVAGFAYNHAFVLIPPSMPYEFALLLLGVPFALFAWAYLMVRRSLTTLRAPGATPPMPGGQF